MPLFRCYRWATLRNFITEADDSLKKVLSGDQHVKFLQHIGGAHYIGVNSGYESVDLRKWFIPRDSKDGEIKPTKIGVSLRPEEWQDLIPLVEVINLEYPSLGSAQPCYFDDNHNGQNGWLDCFECHPFPAWTC